MVIPVVVPEVPVGSLQESSDRVTAVAIVESVNGPQLTFGRQLENCAAAVGAANCCCAIEIPVVYDRQRPPHLLSYQTGRARAKAINRGEDSAGSDVEDRP